MLQQIRRQRILSKNASKRNNFRCLAAESITILDVIPPDIIVSARSLRNGGHKKRNIVAITRFGAEN